jgi:hypothetical protein
MRVSSWLFWTLCVSNVVGWVIAGYSFSALRVCIKRIAKLAKVAEQWRTAAIELAGAAAISRLMIRTDKVPSSTPPSKVH